jgi:signal transduction histidine kinase
MHSFLSAHRDELIDRCKAKVARRALRGATPAQLTNGIPMFIDQLTQTLLAEDAGQRAEGQRISGPAGGDQSALSQIGISATEHGHALSDLGYTVDQVVHDYGDLCQAITDLAVERNEPFSIDQFRTLNRCLDNAIADAVTEFSASRDVTVSQQRDDSENERLGVLVHELRNALQTASLAFAALESGQVPVGGSTGGLVKRSLATLSSLLDGALGQIRAQAGSSDLTHAFPVADFVAEARAIALLGLAARGCRLVVPEVDPRLAVAGNRAQLLAALVNLLQNAFKFTHAHSEVSLHAHAASNSVLFDVRDHCGGLPAGFAERMFEPFTQGGFDRSGLGLGLSIARRALEADGGSLSVRDLPGTGCVFTMRLPLHVL